MFYILCVISSVLIVSMHWEIRLYNIPNLDRLVKRGRAYTNAYSSCPVCVPARYVIRTGKEPYNLGCYCNESPDPIYTDGSNGVESYCGEYLAERMNEKNQKAKKE